MINYKFNKKHINKFNSDGYLYCKKFFDTENFYKIEKSLETLKETLKDEKVDLKKNKIKMQVRIFILFTN